MRQLSPVPMRTMATPQEAGTSQYLQELRKKHENAISLLTVVRANLSRNNQFLQMAKRINEAFPEMRNCPLDDFIELWTHQAQTLDLQEKFYEKQMIKYGQQAGIMQLEPMDLDDFNSDCFVSPLPEMVGVLATPLGTQQQQQRQQQQQQQQGRQFCTPSEFQQQQQQQQSLKF